jgi:hypothetical protein
MISVIWSDFKAFVTARSLSIQFLELTTRYELYGLDGIFQLYCQIPKNGNSDVTDFETNFKSKGNMKVNPVDTDGSGLSRLKLATAGWTFQEHSFEFSTGLLNSNYSKKYDNTDFNFSTMSFYELISNVETKITGGNLTQGYLDSNCVKTVIDWEVPYDIDLINGELFVLGTLTNDVRLWVMAVPDIPYAYGGSKELCTGGKNLKYHQQIILDGRVVKHLTYSATYHTNKLRIILRHNPGVNALLECNVDHYKL